MKKQHIQCEGCTEYNNNKCTRIGKCGTNKGKEGVCWMEKSEGEY